MERSCAILAVFACTALVPRGSRGRRPDATGIFPLLNPELDVTRLAAAGGGHHD
jgi:hypothetical protein